MYFLWDSVSSSAVSPSSKRVWFHYSNFFLLDVFKKDHSIAVTLMLGRMPQHVKFIYFLLKLNESSVLFICGCITNYHNLSDLKQDTFIISKFQWIRLSQAVLKVSVGLCSHLELEFLFQAHSGCLCSSILQFYSLSVSGGLHA